MGKKIYISENQFNHLIEGKSQKNKKQNFAMATIKADRKGRRDADRDIYGDGFKSTTRIAKSEKNYSRKGKNKFRGDNFDDEY
jgi:hypothetical protein